MPPQSHTPSITHTTHTHTFNHTHSPPSITHTHAFNTGGWQGHFWAQPDVKHLQALLRHIHTNPEEAYKKGMVARRDMVQYYSLSILTTKVKNNTITPSSPHLITVYHHFLTTNTHYSLLILISKVKINILTPLSPPLNYNTLYRYTLTIILTIITLTVTLP